LLIWIKGSSDGSDRSPFRLLILIKKVGRPQQ